jgi:hypothetical protein
MRGACSIDTKVADRVFPGLAIIIFRIIKIPHPHGKLLSRRLSSSSIAYPHPPASLASVGRGGELNGWVKFSIKIVFLQD